METSGCLLGSERHGQICVVWSLSAAAPSLAAAWGAAEVGLGSASREGKGTGAQAGLGIRCWEGRPSEGSGRSRAASRSRACSLCLSVPLYSVSRLETLLGHLRAVPNGTGLYRLVSAAVIKPETMLRGL